MTVAGRHGVYPNQEPVPCYFNSGCGLYSKGITNLEISGDEVRLVKWHRQPLWGSQYIVLEKGKLSEFVTKTAG